MSVVRNKRCVDRILYSKYGIFKERTSPFSRSVCGNIPLLRALGHAKLWKGLDPTGVLFCGLDANRD